MKNTYTQRLSSTAGGGLETIFADRFSGNFPCVLLANLHICFRQTPLLLWVPFYENCACEEFESSGRCPIKFWLIKITEIASLAIYLWSVDSWCRHGFNPLLHIGIDTENFGFRVSAHRTRYLGQSMHCTAQWFSIACGMREVIKFMLMHYAFQA